MTVLAWLLGLIMAGLGVLHVAWAFGRVAIHVAVIPERDGVPIMRPGRVATLIVAALLLEAALIVLQQGGVVPYLLPAKLTTLGSWVVALVFLARAVGDFRYLGFFKRVRGSRFSWWDDRLFAPLCLALGIGTAIIAGR